MEKPKNLYALSMDMNYGEGLLEGMEILGRGGQREKNWDNYNQ